MSPSSKGILVSLLPAVALLATLATATARGEVAPPAGSSGEGPREAPRADSSSGIIRLPPFIITETEHRTRWHSTWTYTSIPGFEVLSSCGSAETEEFALDTYRQQVWLDEIVAPELQAGSTVPTTLILFSGEQEKSLSENLASLANANAHRVHEELSKEGIPSPPQVPELIPQVKLWDEDSTGVDIILKYRGPGGYSTVGFEPDYVLYLLSRRAPPLPSWFTVGVLNLYEERFWGEVEPEDSPGSLESGGGLSPDPSAFGAGLGGGLPQAQRRPLATVQHFPPASWISSEITELLREKPLRWSNLEVADLDRRLLPIRALLLEPAPRGSTTDEKRAALARHGFKASGADEPVQRQAEASYIVGLAAVEDSPWRRDVWRSEASLFVRWCLDDESRARTKALWTFASRASAEPATEAMFKACFGFGFNEAAHRLNAYLPGAVGKSFSLKPEIPVEFPRLEVRDATGEEVSRLLGDWQRKEIEFVKPSQPAFADAYARQAQLTLRRAYDDGARSPGLLAALGLYESAAGDDGKARGYLEGAVSAGVERPGAYVQLARLRLAAALAKPAGAGRRLNRSQTGPILDLLESIRREKPPQLTGFLLAAKTLESADFTPAPSDLGLINEGLYFFPSDPRLILAAAQLDAAAGLKGEALRVLDRGLQRVADGRIRGLLLRLRAQYAQKRQEERRD
jgi:hypothetical protein